MKKAYLYFLILFLIGVYIEKDDWEISLFQQEFYSFLGFVIKIVAIILAIIWFSLTEIFGFIKKERNRLNKLIAQNLELQKIELLHRNQAAKT